MQSKLTTSRVPQGREGKGASLFVRERGGNLAVKLMHDDRALTYSGVVGYDTHRAGGNTICNI
jgi:hypothetical protein